MQLAQELELGGGSIDEAKFENIIGGRGGRSNSNSGTTGDNTGLGSSVGVLALEENMVVVQKGKDIKDSSKSSLQQALAIPMKIKKVKKEVEGRVRYRECLRNHVASLGGQAMDGCGEFIASCSTEGGEEGIMQCGACGCHRNFHRREVSGEEEPSSALPFCCYTPHKYSSPLLPFSSSCTAPPIYNQHLPIASNVNTSNGNRQRQMQQMLMSFQVGSNGGSEQQQQQQQQQMMIGFPQMIMKKRFRTKFTNEQKEKMLAFAEKLEWRIQKQDESEVQQFCMEVGIKRHVLKVWMHNNKHTLGKKL